MGKRTAATNRRGMIELPVTTIFAIVVGALIILFFIIVSQSQGDRASRGIQASSLQRLDTLLKSAGSARDAASNISIIDDTLIYTCGEEGMLIAYEGGVGLPITGLTVFSPRSLEGGTLLTATRGAEAPYRATTILYLSTPRFSIENRTDIPGYPASFVQLPAGAGSATRLVVEAGQQRPSIGNILEITPGDPSRRYGSVTYIPRRAGDSPRTVTYVGNELLVGAILSQDAQTYTCVLNNYLRQLRWVNSIERERVAILAQEADSVCAPLYQDAPFAIIEERLSRGGAALSVDDARDIDAAQRQIALMNDNLIRGDSCAWIY